jgi:hypothetical protein
MYIDSEDTAREYIRAWILDRGTHATSNARRFLDAAKSQRAAAGLCRNEGEREAHIAAARVLEAEAARIESDLIDTLTQPR